MPEQSWDTKVRMSAFRWLDEVSPAYEAVLPRAVVQKGFELEGQRIPLVAPNGIFTPKGCECPLSISKLRYSRIMDVLTFLSHEAIREHIDLIFLCILSKPLEIDQPIFIGKEDILTTITTLGDVMR
jgi:hypothetical protein